MPDTHHHPSLLDLELARTGEASAEVAAHVRECAECQAALQQLAGLPEKLFTPAAPPGGFDRGKEEAMFAFIRRRAADIRAQRSRRAFRILPAWLKVAAGFAVAGVIAALVYVTRPPHRAESASTGTVCAALPADDLNRDGRVDILDALALAQQTQGDRSPEVCRLAARIVSLNGGGAG